ncbi:hypothetical protein XH98_35585 [Bradyrhizobium sp. CCBAU 51745]|uniref:hypothetical protein n=1 Tax=Bradyrhizobium sp. CCBAU 51745 TaxID=1325099 RepID=UPI0023054E7A|nr:hypothetical protein [Bradyrhizobium sp. CCBAU 51745]MDA9444328.1 hypothetical protein [Bradyrhizobium sp. CCBAU 51745]
MRIREQVQLNPVSDEVLALTAVVRPILTGTLYALKADIVAEAGGYDQIKLKMLPRLYKAGDGDCGICFEYAVHEAISRGDARVLERIEDAAKLCKLNGQAPPRSLLFGLEKTGTQQLIDTAGDILTDDSRLLYGTRGQPAKLKRHLNQIAGAFRNRKTRLALPYSIRGLWKADLFVGYTDVERWVATTVKINPSQLEGAAGLRIGIVPTKQGAKDIVRKDDGKNLIICPLHHDEDFMQTFYEGWRIVQAFIDADGQMPKEVSLPRPAHREVVRILVERREFPVVDVVEAIEAFGQPELLATDDKQVETTTLKGHSNTDLMIAPVSREPDLFGPR